jgi:hypothetical protein
VDDDDVMVDASRLPVARASGAFFVAIDGAHRNGGTWSGSIRGHE